MKKRFVPRRRFWGLNKNMMRRHRRDVDLYLEVGHANKLVDADFDHVEDTTVEHADEDKTVWSLFGGLSNEEEGCIVFIGPELERRLRIRRGVEWVDLVFLVEYSCIWTFQDHLVESTQMGQPDICRNSARAPSWHD